MADTKISALTSGNPAQSGDEIPIARAGANYKITAGSIASLATVSPGGSSGQIQYNNAGAFDGSYLWQSTNKIEQRNGANAQELRILKTWTDASNWTGASVNFQTIFGQPYAQIEAAGTAEALGLSLKAKNHTLSTTAPGGSVRITTGDGSASATNSSGGNVYIDCGDGYGTSTGLGGAIDIRAGNANPSSSAQSDGGGLTVAGGSGGGGNGNGGSMSFTAGWPYYYFDPNTETNIFTQGYGGNVVFYAGINETYPDRCGKIFFYTQTLAIEVTPAGVPHFPNGWIINNPAFVNTSTNYVRGFSRWVSNQLRVGTEFAGTGQARAVAIQTGGTTRLTVEATGGVTLADANNLATGTTTGTKIGTATTQKIGFWNATPIVQPTTTVAAAAVAATGIGDVVAASTTFDGYTIPQIVKALRNAGLLA